MNSLKLKGARVSKGLNQEETAKKVGVALPTYCNKENGKIPFTTKEISKLSKIFDLNIVEINDIFFDGDLTNRINNKQAVV